MIYRASLRAFCIADSIKFPEAEYSFGIGTATKIPLFMPRFMFESAGPEAENITKQKKRCIIENEETPLPINRAQSSGESTRHGA